MAQPQAQPTSNLAEKVQIICKEIGMPEGGQLLRLADMAVAEIGLAAQVQGLNVPPTPASRTSKPHRYRCR